MLPIFTGTPITKLLRNTICRLRKQVAKMRREAVRTPQQLVAKAAQFLPPQLVEFSKDRYERPLPVRRAECLGYRRRGLL